MKQSWDVAQDVRGREGKGEGRREGGGEREKGEGEGKKQLLGGQPRGALGHSTRGALAGELEGDPDLSSPTLCQGQGSHPSSQGPGGSSRAAWEQNPASALRLPSGVGHLGS